MPLSLQSLMTKLRTWNDGSRNMAREGWDHLSRLPRGKYIYSRLVGRYVPYTGTINALVEELRDGYARVSIEDKQGLRNHMRSVHAVALANLAELTGNLALSYSMPADARFIVSRIEIEYLKKARGTLNGICNCPIPDSNDRKLYLVPVEIQNEAGEVVCTATLHSLVGPKK